MEELWSALDTTPPSVDEKERRKYERMYLFLTSIFTLIWNRVKLFDLITTSHGDFIQSRGDVALDTDLQKGPRQTLA